MTRTLPGETAWDAAAGMLKALGEREGIEVSRHRQPHADGVARWERSLTVLA
ncbi:hypothetical protein RSK60_350008 [Ralstonia solanacearum K60]|nr:hypothetical protein RSK60_350008 [Ralstonia solanacearum K60]